MSIIYFPFTVITDIFGQIIYFVISTMIFVISFASSRSILAALIPGFLYFSTF